MTNKGKHTTKENRIHFLDNLRTIIIFLVILYHAGGVYEATGMWASFWIVDDPATNNVSGLVGLVLDIFVMPTLFLISGYLAPPSLGSKTGWNFVKSKAKRLVLPWIIAVLTLIPLYKVIFLFSRNLPQEHWTTYFHFSNEFISQSWLWFLPMLFLFNILYLLFSKAKIGIPNISLGGAVLGTFLIGFAYSASMDLFGLRGWTLTPLLDFQHERVLIYFMYFLLGALCFRLKVFGAEPGSKVLYNVVNSISWIPITVYIFFLIFPVVISPGDYLFSRVIDRLIVWFCFHLSLFCLVYVVIESFRRYLDKPGRIWKELNRNSYYVYIIHVVVIGVLALLLLNSAMPSLLKYLILAVSTFLASNLIISLYRRAATSRKAINQPKVLSSSRTEH